MNQIEAVHTLANYDKVDRYIYTNSDLVKIFHQENQNTLIASIRRLVKARILVRASRGVYVYGLTQCNKIDILEQLAKTIRRGEYNYVSLESALSEYGVISQIPIDRLTVMTTGRSAEYKTPYGTIEFTHTKRELLDILRSSVRVGRPLRLAHKKTAYRDLKRVGRNIHLIDEEALYED